MDTTRRQGTPPETTKITDAAAPLSASFVEEGEAYMKLSGRAPERVAADRSQRESFEVVVIGGGQAGLSLGYHLAKRGFHFLILDASARVGDSWRSRWDSLRLFTPARYDGLDGMPFPAPPHGFPTKDEMADYLERYAKRFALPIRNAARVDRLRKEGARYVVTVGDQEIETDQVVVAMANYQSPKVPDFATELRSDIVQLHSKEYREPAQLREGSVLVVGAGNSGSEVAVELARHHRVWLSGRHTGHLPFRVGGLAARFLLLRLVLKVLFHRVLTINTTLGRRLRPGIISRGGPLIRIKPRDMVAAGIRRVPRAVGVQRGLPQLAGGRVLDVQNVVWCTGFHPGFSWIDLPIFDDAGRPRHTGGVVESAPGLYFLGLHFLRAVSSGMIHGVSTDAKRIADAVAARRQAQFDDAVPHSGRRAPRSIASGDATKVHGMWVLTWCLLLAAIGACGDSGSGNGAGGMSGVGGTSGMGRGGSGGTVPFAIASIDDQTVNRNTITPREVTATVELTGDQSPDVFSVTLSSDDSAIVTDATFECTTNPCEISFPASSSATAQTNIDIEVVSTVGGASVSFVLRIVPLLVTDRTDEQPPHTNSLRDVIGRAVDGDVIGFDVEGAFSEPRVITLSAPLVVDASVTIEGPGRDALTLDGGGEVQIFDVISSSRLTIADMTLARGMAEKGGAVAVSQLGAFEAARCTFSNNQANEGGAIFAEGASVDVEDCELFGNAAMNGGAALVRDSALTVRGTTFGGKEFEERNSASIGGGAIAALDASVLTIVDSSFAGNEAASIGGAMLVRTDSCEVSDSSFAGNRAGQGGALFHVGASLTIRGCTFDGDRGSGPVVDTTHERFELRDSQLQNHLGSSVVSIGSLSAVDDLAVLERVTISNSLVGRSAIEVAGNAAATMEDIDISGMRSQRGGGAMFIVGVATVRRATLVDNMVLSDEAFFGDGGAIRVVGNLTLEDSELRGNRANNNGGGLSVESPRSEAFVRDTVIRDNIAVSSGGGVLVRGSFEWRDSKVLGNKAASGGGVYVDGGAGVLLTGGQIGGGGIGEGNEADYGGGLFARGDTFLSSVLVNANRASLHGGGVFQLETILTLESAVFVVNAASDSGGGIYAAGGTVTGSGNNFTGNTAGGDGGAIYANGANIAGVMANFALNAPNGIAP